MRNFVYLSAIPLLLSAAGGVSSGEPLAGTFSVMGAARPGWTRAMRSMGFTESPPAASRIIVPSTSEPADVAERIASIESGAVAILEGDSPLARAFGIVPGTTRISTRRVRDVHDPRVRIQWKDAQQVPVYRVPAAARIFATDRRHGAPLAVGITRGRGAVLWLAVSPGEEGYERFPFLPQALADLGVQSPFVSRRLWAFFDPGVHGPLPDPDQQAAQWRRSGIAAVQIAVWDFFEGGKQKDAYLRRLIEACHRHLVLAYAWFELPHVSQAFWENHPEWREKTARLKDAAVDWRLLMNLADPACEQAVRHGVEDMVARLDWDGVNLAELYFDGIQGVANPHEFTPMNDYVRRTFREAKGFDPVALFRRPGRPDGMRAFLDYRVDLAARLEDRWVDAVEEMRAAKPSLDLVLTHVDNLFDTTMRDAIGADASRAVKLLDDHQMTFLVEDPATLWSLGPRRYAEISSRYAALPARMDRVGVDINVVPRARGVFPTAAQTGTELLELIHTASENFSRVAYYCESTVDEGDNRFLPAASSVVTAWTERDGRLTVESPYGVGVRWKGAAAVDGQPWPVQDGEVVWVPPGRHELAAAPSAPPVFVSDLNGTIDSARLLPAGIELTYHSDARALVSLSRKPERLTLDDAAAPLDGFAGPQGRYIAALPRGAHRVLLFYAGY